MPERYKFAAGTEAFDCSMWIVANCGANLEYLPLDSHFVSVAHGFPPLYTDGSVVLPKH